MADFNLHLLNKSNSPQEIRRIFQRIQTKGFNVMGTMAKQDADAVAITGGTIVGTDINISGTTFTTDDNQISLENSIGTSDNTTTNVVVPDGVGGLTTATGGTVAGGGVDRVVNTGETRTVLDTHSLIVSDYFAVEGTGVLALEGDSVLEIYDGSPPTDLVDSVFFIVDDGDITKKATFQSSGITTATTRTFTFPDKSGTLAVTDDIFWQRNTTTISPKTAGDGLTVDANATFNTESGNNDFIINGQTDIAYQYVASNKRHGWGRAPTDDLDFYKSANPFDIMFEVGDSSNLNIHQKVPNGEWAHRLDSSGSFSFRNNTGVLSQDIFNINKNADVKAFEITTNNITFNPGLNNWDFLIKKNISGTAYKYDAGTEKHEYDGEILFNASFASEDFRINKKVSGNAYLYDASAERHEYNGLFYLNFNRADTNIIIRKETAGLAYEYDAGIDRHEINGTVIVNFGRDNKDFNIRKNTAGDAYIYDAGTDAHNLDGTTITLTAPADGDLLTNHPTGGTALAIATVQYVKQGFVTTKRLTNADSPYTVLATDNAIFCDTDAGAITVNLPVGVNEKPYKVINSGTSGNDVTLNPNGTEQIYKSGAGTGITLIDLEIANLHFETTEHWL